MISRARGLSIALTGVLVASALVFAVPVASTAASPAPAAVALSTRALTAPKPTITGTAAVGSKLTVKTGTWTARTTLSFRWYANGTAIAKATARTYTVTSAQQGKRFTVKVTGKKAGYTTTSKMSAATAKAPKTASPTVSGTRQVTKTLTAKTGTWTTGTTFTYRWYANGKAISKATNRTLKLGATQAGKSITVTVTGRKSGYTTVSKKSPATAKIGYPSRTARASLWNCPSWAPIKGNADSGIYHMPGQRFYTRTQPEECFRTETAARNAGYRRSKV